MCKLADDSLLPLSIQTSERDFDSLSDDEKIDIIAKRILEQNKEAFLELAKR